MSSRTAWTAGNGAGSTWTTAINSADLASMASGSTVLSSTTAVANQTNLDQFMDISIRCAIASNTIAAGASLPVWIYYQLDDGTTYGDGQFVAGTAAAKTPTFPPVGSIPLVAAASQTTLVGTISGILLAPRPFLLAMQNGSGFAFTAGTQTVKIITYNQNLNN